MQDMSNCLDSLAMLTVRSLVGDRIEAYYFWYFGDEGLKRSKANYYWEPDGITDVSAKEKLRWNLVCEWLDNYFRRNPARRKPQFEGRRLDKLLRELQVTMRSTLVVNVSNLPGDLNGILSRVITTRVILDNEGFLLILVVLSLVYGGIHLATWNFAFASKTEHLLWKIACIDIMATVPIGFPCILGLEFLIFPFTTGRSTWNLYRRLSQAIIFALSVPYALSRIYIVAESFIGLRHVPIGVYAAVPWVQAIPHV